MKGRVFSGKGEGAEFVNLRWARKQMEEKLGFTPYPGTLNVRLTKNSIKMKQALNEAAGIGIFSPSPDFCSGKLFRANLDDLECAVVIPDISGYREDVVEVIAPTNLREKLHLADGSPVKVEVTF